MDFTSFLFLFLFLPVTVIFFLAAEKRFRPFIIIISSLIFFLWARPSSIAIIIGVVVVNFIFGRWIEAWRSTWKAKMILVAGIVGNLGVLILYKSFAAYSPAVLVDLFKKILPFFVEKWLLDLVFPIGLSYITFQVISYLVDVYKNTCASEKNFLHFSIYILFFPKILSGPITLYRSFADQLSNPSFDIQNVANGLRRFALGLAKKVLIADHLAKMVNAAFGLETPNFSPGIAWLVLIGFALQIYFDFSGYIDMAIGLGQVLGFHLPENFNFPYISRSVGEFWRRWHMTLSAWFREYVFYPLERKRLPILGQQINIMIVFLLTGLWHGLTLPYIIWGMTHGVAIALESLFLGRWLKKMWLPIQHIYTLSIIIFSWVFFRSSSLKFAWLFFKRLFGDLSGITVLPFSVTIPLPFIEPTFILAFAIGLILSLPFSSWLAGIQGILIARQPRLALPIQIISDVLTLALLWASVAALAGGSFTPGIYDKF
jgi:alginate O-acetyltransferase complex protein AlgI